MTTKDSLITYFSWKEYIRQDKPKSSNDSLIQKEDLQQWKFISHN